MFHNCTFFWLIYVTFILTSNISNATVHKTNNNKLENITSVKPQEIINKISNSTLQNNDFLAKSANNNTVSFY